MKKINCYSKIASLICLVIFLISLIVGILPFFLFKAQEAKIFIAVWIIIFAFNILFSAFCFFHYRQYLYVKNGKVKKTDLINAYHTYRNVLNSIAFEKRYNKMFEDKTGIKIYQVMRELEK